MNKNVQNLEKISMFLILIETVYWPRVWLVGFLNATKMTQ